MRRCWHLLWIAFCCLWLLAGCASQPDNTTQETAKDTLPPSPSYAKARPPLPGVAPIQAAPSVPLRRRARPTEAPPTIGPDSPARVFLYASIASQERLMTIGTDPTSAVRIWENYLRGVRLPYARISTPSELGQIPATAVLVLPATVVLRDDEKQAILQWRNRGGSILSTWRTGTEPAVVGAGGNVGGVSAPDYSFMREVLNVDVAGDTGKEVDDTYLIPHGDDPVLNALPAGTRVWLERVPGQLPLRLVAKDEAAQVMSWARTVDAKKPSGLISYNERKMPSGLYSRVVTLGYPEQNWARSDPKQLQAISDNVFSWLQRAPRAYLGAWPYPYRSSVLFAVKAGELVSEGEVTLTKAISAMGGKATVYVQSASAIKASATLQIIAAQGHEMAYFGDTFDGFKGQPVAKQTQRFDAMQRQLRDAGAVLPAHASFAAPIDAFDATTLALLRERQMDNYMAFMDASDDQLPFVEKPVAGSTRTLVVLPRTMAGPEEALDEDADAGLENFLSAFHTSVRTGGLSIVRLPAQSLLVPEQRQRVTDAIQSKRGQSWVASAGQVSAWWRDRAQVSVTFSVGTQTHVLTTTVTKPSATQEEFCVWVNLPHPEARLRLQPMDPSNASKQMPTVTQVDGLRAAVRFRATQVGAQSFALRFE